MTFDLSWALGPVESWDGRFFEAVDLQGKVGNKLFQIVVLPLEVFDLLTGGVSHRVPGETLFPPSMKRPLSLPKDPWSRHRKRLA